MNLFPSEYQALGFSILNDDVLEFEKQYKKNVIIDNQPLLAFVAESKAYNILVKILKHYPKEFKYAPPFVKQKVYKNIFSQQRDIQNISRAFIHILLKNYALNKKDKQLILIGIIRCLDTHDVREYLELNQVFLSYQQMIDLLTYVKDLSHTHSTKQNTIFYLRKYLPFRKSEKVFILLTANMDAGSGGSEQCTELLLFNEIGEKEKQDWIEHVIKKKNMKYYLHKVTPYQLSELNEVNEHDINIDFLFFFVYCILPSLKQIDKTIKKMLLKVIEQFKKDILYIDILSEYAQAIERHLLRMELEQKLKITTVKKGIQKI